ncbi:MAG: hypothetical protein AB7N99_01275 [Simkaniaceae bacterium]
MKKMQMTLFILFFLVSSAMCNENAQRFTKVVDNGIEKIYFSTDQLIVEKEGLFLDVDGIVQQLSHILRDHRGYYIVANYGYCPNGHLKVDPVHCAVPTCPYYYDLLPRM